MAAGLCLAPPAMVARAAQWDQSILTTSGPNVRIWHAKDGIVKDDYLGLVSADITAVCLDGEGRRFFLAAVGVGVTGYNYSNGHQVHALPPRVSLFRIPPHLVPSVACCVLCLCFLPPASSVNAFLDSCSCLSMRTDACAPLPLAQTRPCLSTGWALNRCF